MNTFSTVMKKKERASLVARILNKLFPNPTPSLHHKDPYTLLIAALLSAQSTDLRVNKITPILFAKANTPKKMARLSEKEILKIIRPCGLGPSKAKAIRSLSQELVENYGGKVPKTLEAMEKLSGVGHKTASVVLSQAFHLPAFPVDTHVARCAKRWGLSNAPSVKKIEEDLKKLFPKETWEILHLQIIYFARTFCPSRGHDPKKCPICRIIEKKPKRFSTRMLSVILSSIGRR